MNCVCIQRLWIVCIFFQYITTCRVRVSHKWIVLNSVSRCLNSPGPPHPTPNNPPQHSQTPRIPYSTFIRLPANPPKTLHIFVTITTATDTHSTNSVYNCNILNIHVASIVVATQRCLVFFFLTFSYIW